MTEIEKRIVLRSMIGGTDTEEVLSAYLNLAGSKIIARAFPFSNEVTEVPTKYHTLQVEIAAYLLNKRGAEGQVSHTENGITRQYENADVPDSMLNAITPFCGRIV